MKRLQREPYLGLTRVIIEAKAMISTKLEHPFYRGNMSLCHFCRYAEWWGTPCGGDSSLDCTHPLAQYERWDPNEVWAGLGADCWGFRPDMGIDEAADILGIYLRGEWL